MGVQAVLEGAEWRSPPARGRLLPRSPRALSGSQARGLPQGEATASPHTSRKSGCPLDCHCRSGCNAYTVSTPPIAYDIFNVRYSRGVTEEYREFRGKRQPPLLLKEEHLNTFVQLFHVPIQGHSLEVVRIRARNPHGPELVLLHEGLGSVSHWKTFPLQVAEATGCGVTVYSRYGSGYSDVLT